MNAVYTYLQSYIRRIYDCSFKLYFLYAYNYYILLYDENDLRFIALFRLCAFLLLCFALTIQQDIFYIILLLIEPFWEYMLLFEFLFEFDFRFSIFVYIFDLDILTVEIKSIFKARKWLLHESPRDLSNRTSFRCSLSLETTRRSFKLRHHETSSPLE